MTAEETHRATHDPLWEELDQLVEIGLTASTAGADRSWGPIDLRLRADRQSEIDDIGPRLAPGSADWPTLTVVSIGSENVEIGSIPTIMRPADGEVAIARHTDRLAMASPHQRSLWILRRDLSVALRWVESYDDLPPDQRISPLQPVSRWWAAEQGAATVHAGVVADEHGAVVLVGVGGAGKSTATMSCLGSNLDVLGDDFNFIEPPAADRGPVAHAMYRRAKLDERSLAMLPHLRERVVGVGMRGKSLIALDDLANARRPVVAVCHVVQDPGRPTHLTPMSKAAALRAVAPSTMFQVRLAERTTWSVLSAVVKSVPCFELHVDRVDGVAPVLTDLIERVS